MRFTGSRGSRVPILAGALVLLAGCGPAGGGSGSTTAADGEPGRGAPAIDPAVGAPLLALHLAWDEDGPGRGPALLDGDTLYLTRDPIVTDADLESATVTRRPEQAVIGVRWTPDGADALRSATAAHVGRRVGIVLAGRLRSAPFVNSPLDGRTAQIGIPEDADLDDVLREIEARRGN